ncbi:uncharacterized protein [Littorina saxatilis]|uniref:uncharacterized protein n=1 Tax=Littorina saxatilis TaxID=31220 RepID=UPI0038B5ECB8
MLRAFGEVFHFRSGNGRRFLGAFILCPLGGLVEGVLPFGVSLQKDTDSKQATTMMRIHHSSQEQSRIVDNIQVKLLQRGSTVNEETLEDLKNMLTLRKRVQDDTFNKNQFWRETKKNEVEGVENSKTKNDDDNDSNNSSSSNRYRWNITRCFPAFQKDYDNHALLAEMVAASRAMGVDHFNFYVESIGPNVRKTLQVLQEKGLAEVLPWNLHMNRTLLFYKGQFSAIQDCLYRHLRSSRYLLFGDVDELFMPFTSDSLVDLLDHWIKQRPTCGSFLFRNSFFSLKTIRPSPNEEDNNNNHHADHQLQAFKLATQHGLTMVLHNKRDSTIWKPGYKYKVALDPRRTLVGSVHVVDKMRRGSRACQLDPDEGLLFHFRKGMRPPESRVVDDNRLWRRFAEPVVKETVEILEAVNKTGL